MTTDRGTDSVDIFVSVNGGPGTECSRKYVFFHNSLQPLPRLHYCKRPSKLSTQCECTVTGNFLYNQLQPIVQAKERWQTFFEKTQYLMNTLYLIVNMEPLNLSTAILYI